MKKKSYRHAPRPASQTATRTKPTHLAAADVRAMLQADHYAHLAERTWERDAARLGLAQAEAAAQLAKLEQTMHASMAASRDADAARATVVAELASRYALDWKTTAFDPATGELKALT